MFSIHGYISLVRQNAVSCGNWLIKQLCLLLQVPSVKMRLRVSRLVVACAMLNCFVLCTSQGPPGRPNINATTESQSEIAQTPTSGRFCKASEE